ncbi:MAG: hypothetical protein UR26_C0004G0046 [candidate division TM6 bacterium GW2011_GWF2_32_72]|nr:MAG: hypothetical protein UR26_C0004G0046 [candidate division TM6 bacterium GW2011_GWF2_32_72]
MGALMKKVLFFLFLFVFAHLFSQKTVLEKYQNYDFVLYDQLDGNLFLKLEESGKPVCFVHFVLEKDNGYACGNGHKFYLELIFTEKDYRNRGLASFVLGKSLNILKEKYLCTCGYLMAQYQEEKSIDADEKLIKFYETFGFVNQHKFVNYMKLVFASHNN